MNFVVSSIQFQVGGGEESPSTTSGIAPEKRPDHSHPVPVQGILSTQPGGIAVKHVRPPALCDMQAGDMEGMGILVGEVYDEKIISKSEG